MKFERDIESFIRDYLKELNSNSASVFAGAGLSIPAGFVNWSELMKEIADDLGLELDLENDLISLAQYHVNENANNSKINKIILNEFIQDAELTENHNIIARLPFTSIWTTNYDKLLEKSFQKVNKHIDVKYSVDQLTTNDLNRDLVIYKMHGDASHASSAILTKAQYEAYHKTHSSFINALSGELTTKTFLFIGFSFNDPNLDYVLSRLDLNFGSNKRQHYCFVKKPELGDYKINDEAALDYQLRKQRLIINDLKRYGIKSLVLNSYNQVTDILKEIEIRYKKQTIFISGSAEEYGEFDRADATGLIHNLSKIIIKHNYKIVNGFGWGVGSSILNGALEQIHSHKDRHSESQLIMYPFPQFKSGNKDLDNLWKEYRQKMISKCGIVVFLFGNKINGNEIINADGVLKEFQIAKENNCICLPIGLTGYSSQKIYDIIVLNPEEYFEDPEFFLPYLEYLNNKENNLEDIISKFEDLIKKISIF
ncbi:SIR2 family protein [Empedobacter brevis]|uniref:NAD(+) hydrolase ThsA n=1 Tax=Empedobacter brevis TaxID=247 RepID=A0AAJ1QDZ3_9FLAO|nr:SIR2 family protein [Empedobacter brevis]MDM1072280.1 SIR2 family protein [Empedobacter brevis]